MLSLNLYIGLSECSITIKATWYGIVTHRHIVCDMTHTHAAMKKSITYIRIYFHCYGALKVLFGESSGWLWSRTNSKFNRMSFVCMPAIDFSDSPHLYPIFSKCRRKCKTPKAKNKEFEPVT